MTQLHPVTQQIGAAKRMLRSINHALHRSSHERVGARRLDRKSIPHGLVLCGVLQRPPWGLFFLSAFRRFQAIITTPEISVVLAFHNAI